MQSDVMQRARQLPRLVTSLRRPSRTTSLPRGECREELCLATRCAVTSTRNTRATCPSTRMSLRTSPPRLDKVRRQLAEQFKSSIREEEDNGEDSVGELGYTLNEVREDRPVVRRNLRGRCVAM
eukprot:scaffold6397_cov175-Ochromonas_danica.AAC.29